MTVDPKVFCLLAAAVPVPLLTTDSSGDPARVPQVGLQLHEEDVPELLGIPYGRSRDSNDVG